MGFLSLLPVIVAVVLALWTKRALLALFSGVFVGALLLQGGNPWTSLIYVVDPLFLDSVADKDSMKVILFSLLVSSTVEVMRVGKGTQALVELIAGFATTRRRALVGTWFAGLIVFFDDYANCLIVGSSMRPITDRLKISREKLAYLVDSTAAPVATLALISTWIGYEVSLIDEAFKAIEPAKMLASGLIEMTPEGPTKINAYAFFIEGLPYRFYPILALVFGLALAISTRDFGPMHKAEISALSESQPETAPVARNRIWLGIVPILLLIGVAGFDLYNQGVTNAPKATTLFEIIGAADGYDAMLKGSIASTTAAVFLAMSYRISSKDIAKGVQEGSERLLEAILILILAWSIGSVMKELGSADYLIQILDGSIAPEYLPSLVFVLAAGIAFATGTSFGTMGTLMPLALPLVVQSGASYEIILAVSAAVLSGATWGDHCSPISDTTVLSSAGADCDHAEHVRTQLPYALISGVISLIFCSLPIGFGVHWGLTLVIGSVACIGVILILGKKVELA